MARLRTHNHRRRRIHGSPRLAYKAFGRFRRWLHGGTNIIRFSDESAQALRNLAEAARSMRGALWASEVD